MRRRMQLTRSRSLSSAPEWIADEGEVRTMRRQSRGLGDGARESLWRNGVAGNPEKHL